MNKIFKFIGSLFFVFLLTGCIGETYDFSPPTIYLFTSDGINFQEPLVEANIDWTYDEKYNKETTDIVSLAKKQDVISFNTGELVDIDLEDGDFNPDKISVSLWQNENKTDLEYQRNAQSFYLPNEKGEYVIVIDIKVDNGGSAQYVGNLVIK